MECCYPVECEEYAVTPMLITPSPKYCEEETICYPCLPRCSKPVYYCCERQEPRTPQRSPAREREYCNPITNKCCPPPSPPPTRQEPCPPPASSCNNCCHPPCKPVKTKYIMPCYRYEDGRIERYVPTRNGRLPMSAYRRNGMQDQIHGYRGAIRYLCTDQGPNGEYCVHTAIEPMRRHFPRVTQEMLPVRKKKDKK